MEENSGRVVKDDWWNERENRERREEMEREREIVEDRDRRDGLVMG